MSEIGLFGPGVPGRFARLTPRGRKQMRFVLTTHLLALRDIGSPPEHLARVESLLARYGGQSPNNDTTFKPQVEPEHG